MTTAAAADGRLWMNAADVTPSPDRLITFNSDNLGDSWVISDPLAMEEDEAAEGVHLGMAAHPTDGNRIAVAWRHDVDNLMQMRVTTNRGATWTTALDLTMPGGRRSRLLPRRHSRWFE